MQRIWTKEEDDYMKKNYKSTNSLKIAKDLNRTQGSIFSRAKKLKITDKSRRLRGLKPYMFGKEIIYHNWRVEKNIYKLGFNDGFVIMRYSQLLEILQDLGVVDCELL